MNFIGPLLNFIRDTIRRILEILLKWVGRFGGGGGTIPDDKCCGLARLDHECMWQGTKSDYTCPAGYNRQWWYCCEGTQQIACGECTPSPSTCFSGPWECSIWWYTGSSC